ncbi:MAG: hypothetical protein OXU50_00465, partial [Gammaproteobacteria bacterium]|nr:hypothetical protein [Gammaproteobacteria bacterium]
MMTFNFMLFPRQPTGRAPPKGDVLRILAQQGHGVHCLEAAARVRASCSPFRRAYDAQASGAQAGE